MKKTYLTLILLLSTTSFFAQSTITFYFEFGKDVLTKQSQKDLQAFIIEAKKESYGVHVFTQCDTVGSSTYNIALSDLRLRKMKSLFDVEEITIIETKSLGEVPGSASTDAKQRKAVVQYAPMLIQEVVKEVVPEKETETSNKFAAVLSNTDKSKINPIVLDIQFVGGSSIFLTSAYPEIESLYAFMDKNKEVKAFIRGHVCCTSNMPISVDRARVVYEYLVQKGIDPKRLTYKGFDNTMPVAVPEVTEEDMQRNRRVDVIFTIE